MRQVCHLRTAATSLRPLRRGGFDGPGPHPTVVRATGSAFAMEAGDGA
jgi:hypothetical protein